MGEQSILEKEENDQIIQVMGRDRQGKTRSTMQIIILYLLKCLDIKKL